jgi:hypothetical protein
MLPDKTILRRQAAPATGRFCNAIRQDGSFHEVVSLAMPRLAKGIGSQPHESGSDAGDRRCREFFLTRETRITMGHARRV